MKHRRTMQYLAGGTKAEVTHLWGDTDNHYIRLKLWCKQTETLVTADFAMGTAETLRQHYYNWQEQAYNHACQFGKVHIAKCDA